ncbi:TPA: anti-phage protein KwaB [Vibrio diabolicus]
MNNKEIKETLQELTDSCIGIEVFFVDHEDNLYRSDIKNGHMDDARKAFVKATKSKYVTNEQMTTPFLSQYDDRKHALYIFDFDNKPVAFGLVDKVIKLSPEEKKKTIPEYQTKDNKLSGIKAVILVLKDKKGKKYGFYQHVFNVTLLKSESGILNLTTHQTRVIKLNSDILRVSPNFVFMKVNDTYLIENVTALESQLNFKTVIHQRAELYTEELIEKNFADNFDIFLEKAQEDTSFARKVVKVCRHSAVLEQHIDTQTLIDFVTKEDDYFSVLKLTENGDKFDLNSINRCRKFLELLDDDFLRSPLTKKSYIARAKDRVN